MTAAKASGEFDGADGRGIKSIARTNGNGSAGTTDTYTITYSDNTTSTFSVYNGKNGTNGKDGINGMSATHSWNGTTLTVTSASGTSSANLKGEKGDSGVYVGSNTPPAGTKVQVNPNGESIEILTKDDLNNYLLKNQGVANVGKILVVGADGNLTLTDMPEGGASGDVIGMIDTNNTIILTGALTDGTYSVKYEMGDGRTINIGNMVLDSNVYYSITKNLTNCSISNNTTQAIKGNSYSATITANSGYELKSVTVTMGGSAVSVSGGVINIANVTGNIAITAVAEVTKPIYTNFVDPTSADWAVDSRLSSSGTPKNDSPGNYVTNFIGPVVSGDIVVIENFALNGNAGGYTSSKAITSVGSTPLANHTTQSQASDISVTTTGAQFTVGSFASIQNGYFRFAGKPTSTVSDIVIKIKRNGQWL